MPMLMVVLGVVVSDVGVSGDGDYCSSSVSGDVGNDNGGGGSAMVTVVTMLVMVILSMDHYVTRVSLVG